MGILCHSSFGDNFNKQYRKRSDNYEYNNIYSHNKYNVLVDRIHIAAILHRNEQLTITVNKEARLQPSREIGFETSHAARQLSASHGTTPIRMIRVSQRLQHH